MKNFFRLLFVLSLVIIGCNKVEENPQEEPKKCEVTLAEGVTTESQIEFYISAKDSEEVAYLHLNTADDVMTMTPESVFAMGETYAAAVEPVSHVIEGLEPETEYVIYAASRAKNDAGTTFYSEVAKLVMKTGALPKLLEFVSASKTGFSYKVNASEEQSYYHTYFEGWFFEYQYAMNQYVEGENFDVATFAWNMLATYGSPAKGGQTIKWTAGQENTARNDLAYLVPGIKYYALAALVDDETGFWNEEEKPAIIAFEMEEPGESSHNIFPEVDGISPYSVNVRMECDESVISFFMYDLYPLDQYKTYVAENGEDAIRDYVFEYGFPKGNTYTDTWTVEPGVSYMLCLSGVDRQGDVFYNELRINVPMPEPKITLSMVPYERDLEGYNSYNTLKVNASFMDFIGLDYESSVFYLAGGPVLKSTFDAAVESAGLSGSLEELQENAEMMYAIGQNYLGLNPVYADEGLLASLKSENMFDKVYTGMEPDTEYVYMVIAQYDGKLICCLVSAKTDPSPEEEIVESEAYKAYLGNWNLTGRGTDDWSTYHTYNLRFERLTSNRTFKVYGWSGQQVGQDFPFEASFDEATGKISISTPQSLGKVTVDDVEYEVRFVGKASAYADDLIVLHSHEGTAYTGTIRDNYLHLLSEVFQYAGETKDYKSMSYVLYNPATKEYFSMEPYDLVYFQIMRAL